jgi:hypothetical protein
MHDFVGDDERVSADEDGALRKWYKLRVLDRRTRREQSLGGA